jgi:hypothetical protein
MPSSFSRFLSDEELARVRELYLASLEESALDDETDGVLAARETSAADVPAEPSAGDHTKPEDL